MYVNFAMCTEKHLYLYLMPLMPVQFSFKWDLMKWSPLLCIIYPEMIPMGNALEEGDGDNGNTNGMYNLL